MMKHKIYFSILLLFIILFVLFMFSALSSDMLSKPETNERGDAISQFGSSNALLEAAFDMSRQEGNLLETVFSLGNSAVTTGETMPGADLAQGVADDVAAQNPHAVLIDANDMTASVLKEWCIYNKYRYRHYANWPDAEALDGAAVVMIGEMQYDAQVLQTLQTYVQTGVTLIFTQLPPFDILAATPELADLLGIADCVEPACDVDGVKLFADFFLSKERIYQAGDFYGELDDTQFTIAYYTLRAGYDGYMVGLLDDQFARGIENEELPTLLWRTYTGQSQVYAVNTDLFKGERMLGVLSAFMAKASDWFLYPVVNARAIVMTEYPFLSNENSDTMQNRYSRDTLGFERDIVWPTVAKVFNNYQAVPNFLVSPELDYSNGDDFSDADLTLYWKQIKGLSGTIGLSLQQSSALPLQDVAEKSTSYFKQVLPDFRFYAAFSGKFTQEEWETYLRAHQEDTMQDLSFLLFPYREGKTLFTFSSSQVLSALMTTDGFRHETEDDLQLLSLMTALGYCAQQVDMERALFPVGDEDDWSNLSLLWSKGDTYYRDFAAFDNTSVYSMETRIRRLLGSNFACTRDGDQLHVAVDPFDSQLWFVLRLHGETITEMTGGAATQLSETAWLLHVDEPQAVITLDRTHYVQLPN